MKTYMTANELTGRAIGSLFFAIFGAIWIGLALYLKEILTAVNLTFVAMDFAVLLVMAIWLMRSSRRFPKVEEDPAIRRTFNRINTAQWIAVAIVAFSFSRLHIDAYVLCAITAIVGLHFFPIARLFRYAAHYVTGSVLLVWAAASADRAYAGPRLSAAATAIRPWVA